MNLHTLKEFRHAVYDCFERAGDALFNTIDALLTEDRAHSFPELSLSPYFERQWPNLYEAFEDGRINEALLKRVLAAYLPRPGAGQLLWTGVDTTRIARPKAITSADRSAQHVHHLPTCEKPVTYGWQFSILVALPRFSQEHGYRLQKQALLWAKPRLRTPEQFERWSHLVAIVFNHLVLASDLVEPALRPWESVHRPATPQQVRRGINKLLPQLGTPARSPQPRGTSPGRTKGVKIGKAKRFSVVRKTPKVPPLIPM